MYLLKHDKSGRVNSSVRQSRHYRQLDGFHNINLMSGMEFTAQNQFPILAPYNGPHDWEVITFSRRKQQKGPGYAVHGFENDYQLCPFWTKLDSVIFEMRNYEAVFTPDFSLYVDMPDPVNRWATYVTRFVGAYMQLNGYNVIPTVSWGNATSLNYSLDGLPQHSILGVCGTGINHCSAAMRLWKYGMRRAEEELHPTLFIVYGDPVEIPEVTTEIQYIQPQITKFHRQK